MILSYVLLFLLSCFLLAFSSKWLVGALSKIALFLKVKEFVVGFFIMAFAASLPNLFVGIVSALNKIPQLSFGDVIGGNIVDLTLVLGLAALVSGGGLSAKSRTIQGSSLFTIFIGVFPLLLIADSRLSRSDGILLILSFFVYMVWLFSKKERFAKIYDHSREKLDWKSFIKNLIILIASVFLLLVGAELIVRSASYFSSLLDLPLSLIGLFIVGLGNCLPEAIFSIQAAKRGHDWMILGDLMGGVVMCATLVLGVVSLISPITITNFSPFAIARIFLILSALLFLFCLRSDRKISKKEGIGLIGLYIIFLIVEIFR